MKLLIDLNWHKYKDEKPAKSDVPCFITGYGQFSDKENQLGIAYYNCDKDVWYDDLMNEQFIGPYAEMWAYVPDAIVNYFSPMCSSYITQDGGRCLGTKEIDVCDCKGIRSHCSFY